MREVKAAIDHEEIFHGWLICTYFEAKLQYVEHHPTISKQYAAMRTPFLLSMFPQVLAWAGLIMCYNFMYIKKEQKQVTIKSFLKKKSS